METADRGEGKEPEARVGKKASREERLALALRENLRRRKAQVGARETGSAPAGGKDPGRDPA